MSGRGPRWISKMQNPEATITLSGTFSSNYGYASIDNTTYTAEATVTVENGTAVNVYVSSARSAYRSYCKVTLNGATVQSGDGTYTLNVTADASIVFTRAQSGSFYYWTCAITMG